MSRTSERTTVTCCLGWTPQYARWLRRQLIEYAILSKHCRFLIPLDKVQRLRDIARSDVIATYRLSEEDYDHAPNLKWLHLGLSGVDASLHPKVKDGDVIVTSSVGLHDETVTYAAWAFVLHFATGLHEGYRQKHARIWDRRIIVERRWPLSKQTILIVGTGRIGQGIACLARRAGMTTLGVRRRSSAPMPPHFDRVVTARGMKGALKKADYVVLIVPGGKQTRRMFGRAELDAMKPSAYLINVARGSVIDELELIAALSNGRIAGAGLDVFELEPLPKSHPFYSMPNVAMTPHVAGDTPDYAERATLLFLDNLRRYVKGLRLKNVVDKKRGY